jgi:hypothetical protein
VGLPRKRGADTDQNRNEKAGKGAEYSPANRRPVARQVIIVETGGARRRMEQRLHIRHKGGDIQRRTLHLGALLQLQS